MPGFINGKSGNAIIFDFSVKQIFSNKIVSAIAFATTVASVTGASLALNTSSGDLVPVGVTGPSVGVSISFET